MNLRTRIREVAGASLWLVLAASCHWDGTVYHQYRAVGSDGWRRGDTVLFELPRLPKGQTMDVRVDVRYTGEFPYRDLWLSVRQNITDSLAWQTDTLRCTLYNKVGYPLGHGGTNLYSVEIDFLSLPSDGSGCAGIRLSHCMADDSLKGVSDVGIRIIHSAD